MYAPDLHEHLHASDACPCFPMRLRYSGQLLYDAESTSGRNDIRSNLTVDIQDTTYFDTTGARKFNRCHSSPSLMNDVRPSGIWTGDAAGELHARNYPRKYSGSYCGDA